MTTDAVEPNANTGPSQNRASGASPPPKAVAPKYAITFLSALLDGVTSGFTDLRALPASDDVTLVPVGDYDAVAAFMQANKTSDLYMGVATRATTKDGTLKNCAKRTALFADIDFKTFKDKPLDGVSESATTDAEAERRAREKLAALPYPPSIIVASGGGLHCYWLLTVVLDVQTEEALIRDALRRLCLAVNGDMNAAEPARILRLPGAYNHKKAYGIPRPVKLELCEPSRRYALADLLAVLPEEQREDAGSSGGGAEWEWIADKLKNGSEDGERNPDLSKIIGTLVKLITDDAAIEGMLEGWLIKCGQLPGDPPGNEEKTRQQIRDMIRRFREQDAQKTTEWPVVQSLPEAFARVPAFDIDALLPASWAAWIKDASERAQCPPDFIAVIAIAAYSSVVGRQVGIRPKLTSVTRCPRSSKPHTNSRV